MIALKVNCTYLQRQEVGSQACQAAEEDNQRVLLVVGTLEVLQQEEGSPNTRGVRQCHIMRAQSMHQLAKDSARGIPPLVCSPRYTRLRTLPMHWVCRVISSHVLIRVVDTYRSTRRGAVARPRRRITRISHRSNAKGKDSVSECCTERSLLLAKKVGNLSAHAQQGFYTGLDRESALWRI